MTALPRISVLDHGYVEGIESWGSDEAIVSAARMSTQKGVTGWGTPEKPGDEKLLGFLWRNKHSTPFEFCGMTVEVQAPLFVFREWHRHRTQSYSEASARYSPLPDLNYVPTVERLMANAKDGNKQAGTIKDAEELTPELAAEFQKSLEYTYSHAEAVYQSALRKGVPKELARIHLPVGRYSKMRASSNLRNWLGFLALRLPGNAQYEIRVYARAVKVLLEDRFPRTLALFEETMSHER